MKRRTAAPAPGEAALRYLHAQVDDARARPGVLLPRRAVGRLRRVRARAAQLGAGGGALRRRRLHRRQPRTARVSAAPGGRRGGAHRRGGRLQDRSPESLAPRLREPDGAFPQGGRVLRVRHAAVPLGRLGRDGAVAAQRADGLRSVRAADDRRTHPRQGRRLAPQGALDRRQRALRLPSARPQAAAAPGGGRRRAAAWSSSSSTPRATRTSRATSPLTACSRAKSARGRPSPSRACSPTPFTPASSRSAASCTTASTSPSSTARPSSSCSRSAPRAPPNARARAPSASATLSTCCAVECSAAAKGQRPSPAASR